MSIVMTMENGRGTQCSLKRRIKDDSFQPPWNFATSRVLHQVIEGTYPRWISLGFVDKRAYLRPLWIMARPTIHIMQINESLSPWEEVVRHFTARKCLNSTTWYALPLSWLNRNLNRNLSIIQNWFFKMCCNDKDCFKIITAFFNFDTSINSREGGGKKGNRFFLFFKFQMLFIHF